MNCLCGFLPEVAAVFSGVIFYLPVAASGIVRFLPVWFCLKWLKYFYVFTSLACVVSFAHGSVAIVF